jgi:hypothetical protein
MIQYGDAEVMVTGGSEAALTPIALAGLRILVGLMWLYNVVWKVPPDFGEGDNSGLFFWTRLAVEHPVFAPYSWGVEHVVLPNFTPFGWGVLLAETSLAVMLLTGTAVRAAALLGIAQSISIGLSVAEAPHEWQWAYAMMIGIHAVLLFAPAAQHAAVDALPQGTAGSARRLLGGWGLTLTVIGAIALGINLVSRRDAYVGLRDLEFTLGEYNLRGALVLLAVAVMMLVAALADRRGLALVAAALAALAAISIYVQYGRAPVWLGATSSTAVVFISAAVSGTSSA